MEAQQNNQYNQYNAPVYNGCTFNTTNNYAPQSSSTQPQDVDNNSSVDSAGVTTHKPSVPFLVPDKLIELGTYSISEFVTLFHDAVKAGAPKLSQFIKHYRELEVLNTDGYNKKQTFEELKAFFGKEMNFGYPNFAAYY